MTLNLDLTAAIEAAARAMHAKDCGCETDPIDTAPLWAAKAQTAIEAALPELRRQLAEQIEADTTLHVQLGPGLDKAIDPSDFTRNLQAIRDHYAAVVRGQS